MREIIKCGIARCQSWQELKDYLAPGNIEILFKYKGNTKEIQGVSFKRGEYSFKGSEIDRQLCFSKISRCLEKNTRGKSQEQQPKTITKLSGHSNSDTILANLIDNLGHTPVPNNAIKHKFPSEEEEDEEEEENTPENIRQRRRKMKL